MIPNRSPWLHQLKRTRDAIPLGGHLSTDITIVGGGIAGVTTAYFILRNTSKRVLLLEADKVAHGATGHNAGQLTSYFERPLHELAAEFGPTLAAEGQRAVESAWTLIDQIVAETKLKTPLYRFMGYEGCSTLDQVLATLQNNDVRRQGGLVPESILVAKEWPGKVHIPPKFDPLYDIVPHTDILNLLETPNTSYVAATASQKGCMNSALFTEELLNYLTNRYQDRFACYEDSHVKSVVLGDGRAELVVKDYKVTAERVVLCTNGFENFSILNNAGSEINTSFHHAVRGRIGYMAGYVEPLNHPPSAISYRVPTTSTRKDPTGDPYFYFTRRPHEHDRPGSFNLICAGGPEKVLPNQADYSRQDYCPEDQRELIDEFLHTNYRSHNDAAREYEFCWHGLMGYTPSGVRRVGPEPLNTALLYNLGCNGVGILPSIYGAYKISQVINNEALPPSIFDPRDPR